MRRLADRLALTALSTLDPETAHRATILGLKRGLAGTRSDAGNRTLERQIGPLAFPNPLGIAAGFDKDADVVDPVLALGFGFTEIGSVTPRPQPGNPRPRVFRLSADRAVINRYGFNSCGHARAFANLSQARRNGIVGVNVGANKDSPDRIADYAAGIKAFADLASYFTVNISSPNTPGLRDLQTADNLTTLLDAVLPERDRAAERRGTAIPIFLKIAPDLAEDDLATICNIAVSSALDGLIVSNTTLARSGLREKRHAGEAGGLSGTPLFERSTIVLAKTRRLVGDRLILIGVGGIADSETAWQKIVAGADLLQVYTGLVYAGPALVREILSGLSTRLRDRGLGSIGDAVSLDTNVWADRSIPPA
ncbi:MAG: quinone-dependent dihydroorotate dehydrogenase [Pseudomonadota bacterium]